MSLEEIKEVKSHDKENHSDTNTIKEKELEDQEVSKTADQINTTTAAEAAAEGTTEETQAEAPGTNTTWTAVWDANAQAYYWWNTVTNETTWNNPEGYEYNYDSSSTVPQSDSPLDSVLNTIETKLKKELDRERSGDSNNVENTVPYSNYFEGSTTTTTQNAYSSQAHFNSRTGRFTTQEDVMRLNPENFTIENRATKQMSYYFDVDSYTEEYNRHRHQESGKKKPLSRKQVDYFKRMKKEKKQKRAREWLLQ